MLFMSDRTLSQSHGATQKVKFGRLQWWEQPNIEIWGGGGGKESVYVVDQLIIDSVNSVSPVRYLLSRSVGAVGMGTF